MLASPDPALDVSVVVVSYNTRDILARCLASIERAIAAGAGRLSAEVFVVDNASADGSARMVAERFPGFTLIASERNEGFGRANNRAFRRSRGRYLLMLNPDTEIAPDGIRQLIDFADAHPRAGAVGGRVEYANGSLQHSAFRFPDLAQAFFGFFDVIPINSPINGRHAPTQYNHPFRAQHLLGACLLLRREALLDVGLLDPRFFMYFEETDLCRRLADAGWDLLYTPAARVMHLSAASTTAVNERMSIEFGRSQALYYRKHHGPVSYLLFKLIVCAGLGYRLARSTRAVLIRKIGPALFAERFLGYWRILWA
ncbi:MAG: glycosyltransferase family 2 protein [Chloroflexota bacterium]